MGKIWQALAVFDDWDSNFRMNIGFFSEKALADSVAEKWRAVFKSALQIIETAPENWDPRQDEYYRHPYYLMDDEEYGLPGTYEFHWTESALYEQNLEKYEYVKFFTKIEIHEYETDKDVFLKAEGGGPLSKADLSRLLGSLARDYKLQSL